MRINIKCSIAMHCLLFIAEYENRTKVTSQILSESTGCNSAEIRNILNKLKKANIITIVRGVGGAHLNRHPKQISMWNVYKAVDTNGINHLVGMHPNPSDTCPIGKNIETVLKHSYQGITDAMQSAMRDITLQELLDDYHSSKKNSHNGDLIN